MEISIPVQNSFQMKSVMTLWASRKLEIFQGGCNAPVRCRSRRDNIHRPAEPLRATFLRRVEPSRLARQYLRKRSNGSCHKVPGPATFSSKEACRFTIAVPRRESNTQGIRSRTSQ